MSLLNNLDSILVFYFSQSSDIGTRWKLYIFNEQIYFCLYPIKKRFLIKRMPLLWFFLITYPWFRPTLEFILIFDRSMIKCSNMDLIMLVFYLILLNKIKYAGFRFNIAEIGNFNAI